METVTVSQLKLHSFELPEDFTGGTVLFKKTNCLELRYFFSKTNDVMLSLREGIGGFYEIRFQNEKHDYWKSKATLDQKTVSLGSELDFTKSLTHFQGRFGKETKNYLYFFCPFIKVGVEETEFEIEIKMNKNPTELKEKSVLDQEVFDINSGKEVSSENKSTTLESKIEDILKEIKGDGTRDGIKTRMEESPQNYFEISFREINVSLDGEQSSDVKKVKINF